ncbi:telomeric repeat binding factor a isoform X2 [Channa argus]|uniref:telomeric repeat binding factor a isoform X2 n=1 Tax=Channa argus TaxID=215402 RepID=UPI003521DB0E
MAANETVNSDQTDVEPIINRWIVDYYAFQAIEMFENDQYEDFCRVREVLDKVLDCPVENSKALKKKIQVLKFLSRINEGEDLEMSFEHDKSVTPLESALKVLENWPECNIQQHTLESVFTSIKEMKPIFLGLIRQKKKTHKLINQIDFHQFKMDMLAFCKKVCTFDVPFLHTAAKQLIEKRLEKLDNRSANDESGPSSSPQMNTVQTVPCNITMARLQAAHNSLAATSLEKPFSQLLEEVEREEQLKKDDYLCGSHTPKKGANRDYVREERLFQRDSGSPIEGSPADQPPQTDAVTQTKAKASNTLLKSPSVVMKRQLYTISDLVVGPDSQASSQCTTSSQELETDVRTVEQVKPTEKHLQCPITENEVTIPTRKLPRPANRTCTRASNRLAELSGDSEEDLPALVANGEIIAGKRPQQSNTSLSRKSTNSKKPAPVSEEEAQESGLKTPVREPCKQLPSNPLNKDPGNTDEVCITDSSLDASPYQSRLEPVPQKSSTPHKASAKEKDSSHLKWRQLFKEAKETKETWSDEESYVNPKSNRELNESTISNSAHRKRKWTDDETQMLKDGVQRFGEGNWSKIRDYYKITDRTNVNLKDRWRTMRKLKMV